MSGTSVWGDYNTPSDPTSGRRQPDKVAIREWSAEMEGRHQLIEKRIYAVPGTYTWTRPDDCTCVYVEVLSAGASGGSCLEASPGYLSVGTGGGGGGASSAWVTLADGLGATEQVQVGAGGAPNPPGGYDGNPGGDSWFGSGSPTGSGVGWASCTGAEQGHRVDNTQSNNNEGGAGGNRFGGAGLQVAGCSGGAGIIKAPAVAISGRGGSATGPYGGAGGKEALSYGNGHGGNRGGGGSGGFSKDGLPVGGATGGPGGDGLVVVWAFR